MKTKKNRALLFAIASILLSTVNVLAAKQPKFKVTASGLEYCIIEKGKGEQVEKSYRLFISYITRINNDTTVFDANPDGKPFAFIVGEREGLPGWDEALLLMHVGDSAIFKIPASLAYGAKRIGRIPANSTLEFHIRVFAQEQAYFVTDGLQAQLLDSHLLKYTVKKSDGETVVPFRQLTMAFTGYIKDESGHRRIFQSSLTNSNKAIFQLGAGRMVKGLEIGLATMKVGEKATFVIPPYMAFGNEKNGIIPPNSTLYFDIEVLTCKDPFLNALSGDTIHAARGVNVLKVHEESGSFIGRDQIAKVHCVSYYIDSLNHKILLSSTRDGNSPVNVRVGSRNTMLGMTLGLELMRKGEVATVVLPYKSELKIGIEGQVIKFVCHDIEVLDVFSYPFFDCNAKDTTHLENQLKYIVVRIGSGEEAKDSSLVTFAYTGFIMDSLGKKMIFDASRENGRLLNFNMGKNEVIAGFEKGITGMKTGEGRRLIIPSAMGYGEKGIPSVGIPPNATLYFDVELMHVGALQQSASK